MIVMTGRTRKSIFNKSLRSSMSAPAPASMDMEFSSFSSDAERFESAVSVRTIRWDVVPPTYILPYRSFCPGFLLASKIARSERVSVSF